MSRVRLVRGSVDLPPQTCNHCGRRAVIGIVYTLTINGVKLRACSFECWEALRAVKEKEETKA